MKMFELSKLQIFVNKCFKTTPFAEDLTTQRQLHFERLTEIRKFLAPCSEV